MGVSSVVHDAYTDYKWENNTVHTFGLTLPIIQQRANITCLMHDTRLC